MTETQKDQLRRDRQTMSPDEVARKHAISRQYVYLIMAQQPDEAKRSLERQFGIDDEA